MSSAEDDWARRKSIQCGELTKLLPGAIPYLSFAIHAVTGGTIKSLNESFNAVMNSELLHTLRIALTG